MFKTQRSHEQFQLFLETQLSTYFANTLFLNKLIAKSDIIFKIFSTDLTPVRQILIHTYQPRGEKPFDPVCLFRSYLLMCQYGNAKITNWVDTLNSTPLWAILSGFSPSEIPSVGTFYNFENRLCDFDNGKRVQRINKLKQVKSKPKNKPKKNQKLPPKHKGIVKKLIDYIIENQKESQPQTSEYLLNKIFKTCFVMPSANKGLLGDTTNLSISGDGMVFETGALSSGIKECDCHKQGNYKCDCPRRFTDPDANWGWDSYREKFVFGYSNYSFTTANNKYDLPIFSTIAQASRHDSVTHTFALYRMKQLYPEFNFSTDILDSAHDNYATYELLDHWNIEAFIALNKRNQGNFKYDPPIDITDKGVPICKAGFEMVNWGHDKKRRRIKWRCPHKVLKSCTCPQFNCSDSDYGRTMHTKLDWDLRIFTSTPRDSKKWNDTMKKRSSSERRNKRVKIDYNLEQDNVRSKSRWLIRIMMRDAALHTDAWAKDADINTEKWIISWLNLELLAA